MTRPGEPSLRDYELIALGMALANGKCAAWLTASLSKDDFADEATRNLFVGVREGRAELSRVLEYWGEKPRQDEPAIEAVKRLLLRRAIEAAPADAAASMRWMTRGKNVTPEMALAAMEEQRARLQKLADAEAALRPQAKEDAA